MFDLWLVDVVLFVCLFWDVVRLWFIMLMIGCDYVGEWLVLILWLLFEFGFVLVALRFVDFGLFVSGIVVGFVLF